MKKLVLLLIISTFLKNATAQMSSNCNAPVALQVNYDKDVKHLALQRINSQNSPYQDSIVIPTSYQDTIMDGLAAIFNLTSFSARDSVFDNYCIHQDISSVYTDIYVGVDTSYAWTHNWQSLNTTTGIPALDNLLSMYGFSVVYYSGFTNLARLSTSQRINAAPLCDSIESFAGVNYSEPGSLMGDGNRVEYSTAGSDRFYDFSVGYGDCPAGCTSRRYFKFKVEANCSVTYIGRFDFQNPPDICPAPLNCYITSITENSYEDIDFTAFPNPATNNVTITAKDIDMRDVKVDIIDLLGKKMPFDASLNDKVIELFVEKLDKGVYFLQLTREANQRKIIKIVKD